MDTKASFQKKLTISIAALTVLLACACFWLDVKYKQHGILMLALVCLGTAFDFSLSIIGDYVKSTRVILLCTKISFSLLNFGVVFTAMAAAYVVREMSGCDLSLAITSFNHVFLLFSIVSGVLFLFTKYVPNKKAEGLFTLDRKDGFTLLAFIVRRISTRKFTDLGFNSCF